MTPEAFNILFTISELRDLRDALIKSLNVVEPSQHEAFQRRAVLMMRMNSILNS